MTRKARLITVWAIASLVALSIIVLLVRKRSRDAGTRTVSPRATELQRPSVPISSLNEPLTATALSNWAQAVPGYITPLTSAVGQRRFDIVQALVAQGADVNENSKGFHGWTPLFAAIFYGDNEHVIDFLLEHGADPNVREAHGETPLMYAITMGDRNTNLVQKLIQKGADVNARDNNGTTPLQYARGRSTIVEILKRAGAKE